MKKNFLLLSITVFFTLSTTSTATAQGAAGNGVTVAGQACCRDSAAGAGTDSLFIPTGVFVDVWGDIYIADAYNNRIQKWVQGARHGVTVAGGNGPGSAANQLFHPNSVFVDASSNIYIADYENNRIQKWASGATSGITVAGGNGGGNLSNQFYGAIGVAVDASGNVYVADEGNSRIQKWVPGATRGITVAGDSFGFSSNAANQLSSPNSVFVDGSGNIYIADYGNDRIQKWRVGDTTGITVIGSITSGNSPSELQGPVGVIIDGNNNAYIADFYNNRIQKWKIGDTAGITVAGGNGQGSRANQFVGPNGLFVDRHGYIYVADVHNHRVQKWDGNVGIEEPVIVAGEVSVYPNPTAGKCTIVFDLPESKNATITLTDLMGRTIKTIDNSWHDKGSTTIQFDTESYSSGIYLVRFSDGEHTVVKRLGIQHTY